MAAKNAKRSRHPRHFVVAAYSTMKNAQEAADGYLEALSFAPTGNGWKQGKLKGEITKTESSGKKSDKYGVLHSTYRDDEAVLGHLRILTLTVNQPPEDEIDYMTAETFGATTASGHTVEYDDGSFYMKFAEPIQGYDSVGGDWYGGDNESPDDIDLQVYHTNEDYDDFEISISDVESYGVSADKRNRWRLDNDSRGNGPDIFVDMSDELVEAIEEGLKWMLGDNVEEGVRYGAESVTNFKGEMKTLVQTYVELLYPDDSDMQAAIFENITSGKESVSLKEMQDYVATRSSWYAEIEAVNPSMAVIHNQNNDFVGSIEVLDDSDDPDSVEVFVNDDQMNEVSSTNLYEDGQFWEDYDAETFGAENEIMVHQLITHAYPSSYVNTYIYRDEKDLMDAIWHDHACERMEIHQDEYPEYDWDGYIDSDENRAIFDKKTKDMSINKIFDYCGLSYDLTYKKIPLNLEGFSVNGEYGEIRNLTRNSGILRAETFEAQLSFDRWSKDEMNEELHGGRDMNFEDWLEDEVHTHGNIPLKEWGDEEESESEHQHAEFNAAKGIDAYEEPFEEIGSFYSGSKGKVKIVGLGALVAAGIWITKNKLLE